MSDQLAYVEPERTPPVRYAPCVDHVDAIEDAQFTYRETRDGRLVFLAYTSRSPGQARNVPCVATDGQAIHSDDEMSTPGVQEASSSPALVMFMHVQSN